MKKKNDVVYGKSHHFATAFHDVYKKFSCVLYQTDQSVLILEEFETQNCRSLA